MDIHPAVVNQQRGGGQQRCRQQHRPIPPAAAPTQRQQHQQRPGNRRQQAHGALGHFLPAAFAAGLADGNGQPAEQRPVKMLRVELAGAGFHALGGDARPGGLITVKRTRRELIEAQEHPAGDHTCPTNHDEDISYHLLIHTM